MLKNYLLSGSGNDSRTSAIREYPSQPSEFGGIRDFESVYRRQVLKLLRWTDSKGTRFPLARLTAMAPLARGMEHNVWYDQTSGRVVKLTRSNTFGILPTMFSCERTKTSPFRIGMVEATPESYLNRIEVTNRVFKDDIRVEGVFKFLDKTGRYPNGEGVAIVTSQPFRESKLDGQNRAIAPRPHEIVAMMNHEGFNYLPDSQFEAYPDIYCPTQWWREDGIVAIDTHAGNFVRTERAVVPIDVPLAQIPIEYVQLLKSAFVSSRKQG